MSRVHTKLSEISSIRPSCIDAHPKRPWIASAAENGVVRIFDYLYNQLVHQFSLADLELAEKNAQLLQAMAEKDPTYKGPRKAEPKTNKKAIGDIKIIKFIDQDIRFNKFRHEVRSPCANWISKDFLLLPLCFASCVFYHVKRVC